MIKTKILFEIDYFSMLLTIGLIVIGILALAGATIDNPSDTEWVRQIQWTAIGFLAMIGILFVDFEFLVRCSGLIYIVGLFSLLLCFTPLGHSSHGADSWIKILPSVQVQPSEFAKLATILFLAKWLSKQRGEWNGLLDIIKPLVIGAIPSLLILKQPDYGTALVFVPVTLIMMYVAGLPGMYLALIVSPALSLMAINHDIIWILIWLVILLALLAISLFQKTPASVWAPFLSAGIVLFVVIYEFGPAIWNQVPSHARMRFEAYFAQDEDIRGSNWNLDQSKIALGSGGFWGKGVGMGTQSKYKFLPEFKHDFAFSVLGEQMGFLWVSILLGGFFLLLTRGVETAVISKTLEGSLIVTGILSMFFTHITINVGMVTGLLPVTGLPFPFISYGGSFLLSCMLGIGLIVNVRMRSSWERLRDKIAAVSSQMRIPEYDPNSF